MGSNTQTVLTGGAPLFVEATVTEPMIVHNGGPSIAYYATNSSVDSADSTLAVDATVSLTSNRWFTSAGRSVLTVSDNGEGVTVNPDNPYVLASELWFNVKHYGAIGDGEADDRPGIQAAMDACRAAGGGVVWFPPGTYSIGSFSDVDEFTIGDDVATVVVWEGCHLLGAGQGVSIVRQDTDSNPTPAPASSVFWIWSPSYDEPAENWSIRDLTIDGNRTEVYRGNGVTVRGTRGGVIDRVTVKSAWNNGVLLQAARDFRIGTLRIHDISSKENVEDLGVDTSMGHGLVLQSFPGMDTGDGAWTERGVISSLILEDVQHAGVRVGSARHVAFGTISAVRQPESPFFYAELTEELAPEDTVAVCDDLSGAWQDNGSLVMIGSSGGERVAFDAISGNTLTGVELETTDGGTRDTTWPVGTQVRLGRTAGYGAFRAANDSYAITVASLTAKGYRRGIFITPQTSNITISSAYLEYCGYQGILLGGEHNSIENFIARNCCVYASENLEFGGEGEGDSEEDFEVVDQTAVRLEDANHCRVTGTVVDDRPNVERPDYDPEDTFLGVTTVVHDFGVRQTNGDYNHIDVHVTGFNSAPVHAEGIHNRIIRAGDDGSSERPAGFYVGIPLSQETITITGNGTVKAITSQSVGLNLEGAHSIGATTLNMDGGTTAFAVAGDRLIVGTGAALEIVTVTGTPSGNSVQITGGLVNNHVDAEAVYPFRWPVGHPVELRFTGTPTLEPTAVLKIDGAFTPENSDDRMILIGDYDGKAFVELPGIRRQQQDLLLGDVDVVASQAAQLALAAEAGDIAIRSDESKTYIHNGGSAGTMSDWTELVSPPDTAAAAHISDTVLDGGPHGFPSLSANHSWVNVAGTLTSVDVASQAELDTHTGDTALDGGPHGLPSLAAGQAWVNVGGVLTAVDIGTQAEQDAAVRSAGLEGLPGVRLPRTPGYTTSSTFAPTAGRLYLLRFVAPVAMSITKFGLWVETAAGADDALHIGIYNASTLARVADSGALTGILNATGLREPALSTSLTAGTAYYAAFLIPTAGGAMVQMLGATYPVAGSTSLFGTTAPTRGALIQSGLSSLPDPAVPPGSTASVPIFAVRES